jgi:hypothetical protein
MSPPIDKFDYTAYWTISLMDSPVNLIDDNQLTFGFRPPDFLSLSGYACIAWRDAFKVLPTF